MGEERGGGGRRHARGRDAGDVRVHKRCNCWIECEAASVMRVVVGTRTARQRLEKFAHGGESGCCEGGGGRLQGDVRRTQVWATA